MRLIKKSAVSKYLREWKEAVQDKTKLRPSDTTLRLVWLLFVFLLLGHYVACIVSEGWGLF